MLAIFLAIPLSLIPTQLGILYFFARKENKKIKELILFRKKTPIKKMVFWIVPIFCWLALIMSSVPEIEKPFYTVFEHLPQWILISYEAVLQQPVFIIPTIICAFIFNGILGPIVEEVYFQGFLLPRMKQLGKMAQLVNTILFSLYHLFTPWENLARILSMFPYIYAVWRNEDIRIGMIVHCLGNMLGFISVAVALLA